GRLQEVDAVAVVAEQADAARLQADDVPLHDVPAGVVDQDAAAAVAGDEVAGAGGGAADEVVLAAADDAVEGVAAVEGTADVGADVVPLDDVRIPSDDDADLVTADDVAGPGGRAAHGVPG